MDIQELLDLALLSLLGPTLCHMHTLTPGTCTRCHTVTLRSVWWQRGSAPSLPAQPRSLSARSVSVTVTAHLLPARISQSFHTQPLTRSHTQLSQGRKTYLATFFPVPAPPTVQARVPVRERIMSPLIL